MFHPKQTKIKIRGFAVALAGFLAWAAGGSAAVVVSVDMDPGTAGIQPTILVNPGDPVMVDLVMTVDAAGVSSFSISANFDTSELSLVGSPAASYPALPGGLAPGIAPTEDNILGRVWSFSAFTPGTGPSLITFPFGSIKFTATAPTTDLLNDVVPGFHNMPGAIDSFFDNAGNSVTPTFVGGTVNVVPEPGSAALLLAALGALALGRGRRRV